LIGEGIPVSSEHLKASNKWNLWADRIALLSVLLIPALIFGLIAWLHPFWGPMDDSVHVLEFVPRLLKEGVVSVSWNYAVNDLKWGMFRPLYPAMAALIYLPGIWLGSTASYLWNAVLVFALVGAYCTLMARILRLPARLVLLACASFFYAWDLLQHLSLQEKLVLTFGGLQVLLAWNRARFSALAFWPLFGVVTILGFCSKASIVIHFSVAIVAYLGAMGAELKRGRKLPELAVLVGLLFLQVFLFAKISSTGSYTKQYDFAKVLPNLLSPQGAMLWLPLVLCIISLALRWREVWREPALLIPSAGAGAFLVLFLPWGIQAYVQSVAAPLFAALLVQLAFFWFRALPSWLWVTPLCLLALAVSGYRGATMFGRLSDLGALTRLGPELYRKGIHEVWMPCEEGSGAMQQFWKANSEPSPAVHFLKGNEGPGTRWLIYDQALCPFPGRVKEPEGCAVDLIWRGHWPKSYRVVMADCR
jgi:hypothetical protein